MRVELLVVLVFTLTWEAETQSNCGIGGFLAPDGTCVCHRFWKGSSCNETECINGGYSLDGKVCICPTGYLGPHCDAGIISRPPTMMFAKQSSFNLVIYNAFSDYWGKAGFSKIKESVSGHLKNFSYNQYNLAIFTEASGNFSTNSSTVKEDFLGFLNQQAPIYPRSYECTNQSFYGLMYNYIKSLKLRDTAVTVITQFPPKPDEDKDKLQELAMAFNVRINVIWISDEIYIRCFFDVNKQYEELSQISFATGGLLVQQKYGFKDVTPFTDVVIASHYQYQPIGFGAFENCSESKSVSWQADPQPLPTYLLVDGADTVTMRGCPMNELPSGINEGGQRIFNVTTSRQRCTLTLSSSKGGQCSAKVFLSDTSNSGIRLYSSFVEDTAIDSSSYRPTAGNKFYITMRVEVNGKGYNVQPSVSTIPTQSELYEMIDRHDQATFTYITNDSFKCDEVNNAWLWAELRFSVNNTQEGSGPFMMQRYIQFKCYQEEKPVSTTTTSTIFSSTYIKSSSTVKSSSVTTSGGTTTGSSINATVSISTSSTDGTSSSSNSTGTSSGTSKSTNTTTTTTSAPTTTPKPDPKNFPIDNPSTFAYGFANSLPKDIYATFLVATLNNVNASFGNFGMIRFEVDNATTVVYHPEDTIAQLTNDIYITYAYGTITSTPLNIDSQVLTALESIVSSEKLYENSLISFCLDRLPNANQYQNGVIPYSSLVNKNVKTLFLLDRNALDRELKFSRTASALNEIAAATNGHLIVSDQSNQSDFSTMLQLLYTQGPAQSLLFARSVKSSQKNALLGTIDIKHEVQITITVTTNVYNSSNLQPLDISLMFIGSTETVNLTLNYTKGSNFFVGTALLQTQSSVQVFFDAPDTDKDIHIRIWIPRTDQKLKMGYADLNGRLLSKGPDTINGAAARATIFRDDQAAQLSIDIRDCASNEVKLFDGKQIADVTAAGDAFFVPFFCTGTSSRPNVNCADGTHNKYDIQFISSSGLTEMRSFICLESPMNVSANCQQKDNDGNYECIDNKAPFYRGPTGFVLDCSRQGSLFYNVSSEKYECKCDDGYTGKSCQIGICKETNTPEDEADVRYRSYTVVIGVDQENYGTEVILLEDAGNIALPTQEPSTVWRYQLILYCDNGNVLPIYIGGSFKEFAATMSSKKLSSFCISGGSTVGFDLTLIYRAATAALGRFVRGMTIFYNEAPSLMKVDLSEFIKISSVYRQEIYIYAVYPEDPGPIAYKSFGDVRDAAYITGGNILFGELNEYGEVLHLNVFSEMLSSLTSLTVHANHQLGSTSLFVDNGAIGYVFTSGADSVRIRDANGGLVDLTPTGPLSSICKLNGGAKYTVSSNSKNDDYSVSVVILNGLTPSFSIVDQRKDAANTAVASPNSPTGPSIVFTLPSDWKLLTNSDNNYRLAERQQCTFGYGTFTVFPAMKDSTNFVTVTFAKGSTTINRVVPIASTAGIDCKNGGVPDTDRCSCPAGFSTPDCSRPDCNKDLGVLSTWGDVCNCEWYAGGRLCKATLPV